MCLVSTPKKQDYKIAIKSFLNLKQYKEETHLYYGSYNICIYLVQSLAHNLVQALAHGFLFEVENVLLEVQVQHARHELFRYVISVILFFVC